ncbi:MAG: DUF5658 family protein [Armatimonadota bacterium]
MAERDGVAAPHVGTTDASRRSQSPEPNLPVAAEGALFQSLWLPIVLFAVISTTDAVSTMVLLQRGLMSEFNPLMRFVLERFDLLGFALTKLLLIIVPVSVFAYCGQHRPDFARRIVWLVNILYVLTYAALFWVANS